MTENKSVKSAQNEETIFKGKEEEFFKRTWVKTLEYNIDLYSDKVGPK